VAPGLAQPVRPSFVHYNTATHVAPRPQQAPTAYGQGGSFQGGAPRGPFRPPTVHQQIPADPQQPQGAAGAAPRPKKQKKKVSLAVKFQGGSSQGQGVHGFPQANQQQGVVP
jgi:hypothetical protein